MAAPSTRRESLYRQNILDHYKSPHHWGKLTSPNVKADGANPLCGDELHLELNVSGGKISGIAFSGQGCAISIASASMLSDEVVGKTIEQARRLPSSRLLELLGIDPGPSRLKCALLSHATLQKAVEKKK